MPGTAGLETFQIHATIRFIQGYRYLDRCGEALIRLEKVLSEGWIPSEPYVSELDLCVPRRELLALMGGHQSAIEFTIVTSEKLSWNDLPVEQRRRLHVSVVRQEKQPALDTRLLQRVKLLPERQREAMTALLRLKHQHPDLAPVAAQLDLENSFETEFTSKEFDFPAFLEQSWNWAEQMRRQVPEMRG